MNYLKMNIFYIRAGQGVLETIIGLGILVMGVVGALGLTVTSIRGTEATTNTGILTQFAREGVEVARGQRDSNWLAHDANPDPDIGWDTGFPSDGTAIPVFYPETRAWTLDAAPDDITNPEAVIYSSTDAGLGRVVYAQFSDPDNIPAVWTATKYRRILKFQDICAPGTNPTIVDPGDCDSGFNGRKIGIRVIAQTQAGDGSDAQEVVIEEHLYQWKYVE